MVINHNNRLFTDNSQKANEKSTFVISKHNEKYVENAKENGCTNFINSDKLENYFEPIYYDGNPNIYQNDNIEIYSPFSAHISDALKEHLYKKELL